LGLVFGDAVYVLSPSSSRWLTHSDHDYVYAHTFGAPAGGPPQTLPEAVCACVRSTHDHICHTTNSQHCVSVPQHRQGHSAIELLATFDKVGMLTHMEC
jgi:hypothetical protein